jgi:hypothetical protein
MLRLAYLSRATGDCDMATLINVHTTERFDDDSPDIVVFGYCSNCGEKVYEQHASVFPGECPSCKEKLEEIIWNDSDQKIKIVH